ncbi:MAG TPA: translation initiation factor IF-2 [Actinomycetota bacterium]|nr:translation initiation factor IF-2 [Actinomycetota bacterium]
MRVHELARELNVQSKDILAALEEMGLGGRTASSSVPDEAIPRLRASGGKPVPGGAKPKAQAVEPLPERKPEPEPEPAPQPAAEAPPAASGNGQAAPAQAPAPAPAASAAAQPAAADAQPAAAAQAPAAAPAPTLPALKLTRGATAQEVADKTGRTAADVVKTLFQMGEMVPATASLSDEVLEVLAHELGYEATISADITDDEDDEGAEAVDESRLVQRPPVVTVMGHVDHGKTLLLDAIRSTDVVGGEHGGITQHIGAYQVHVQGREITFIDTPGHEAFTAMRARGAEVTDIVVLVVAADDGVMPQTIEALNHAKAANVPIIVAVNKIDREDANPTRVRQQLTEQQVIPAEYGGSNEFIDVSAKTGQGLQDLLTTILLVADIEDLKADPDAMPKGSIIEANLDKGRGPVATVLVMRGTLQPGDAVVSGTAYGRVRAMVDENGQAVQEAGPAKPVQVLGWSHAPEAGDDFKGVDDEREARHIAAEREARTRAAELVASRPPSLMELMQMVREGEVNELNLVIKADAQGNLEALGQSLEDLATDEVRVNIIHRGVGGITENDVRLALASQAIVMGYNVRPNPEAAALAEKEGVELRLFRIIYEAIDSIKAALSGMLAPEERVVELGRAEVRAVFRGSRMGVAAGSYVLNGVIQRGARARLVRDGRVVWEGRIDTLRRFKDDVREVAEGFECGIGLENFQDIHEGDVIEDFEIREVARSL